MCVSPTVLTAITSIASLVMSRNQQRDRTPQIARNEIPASRLPTPAASGSLDPEKIKKDDEDLTVSSTPKQKKDRQRVREGLKTLSAIDPATASLPSSPDQGIST